MESNIVSIYYWLENERENLGNIVSTNYRLANKGMIGENWYQTIIRWKIKEYLRQHHTNWL